MAYSDINHTVFLCILYILPHTFQPYSPPFSIYLHSWSFPTLTVEYQSSTSYTQHKIQDRFRYTNNSAVLDCHSSLGLISQVVLPWIILILDLSPSPSNGSSIVHAKQVWKSSYCNFRHHSMICLNWQRKSKRDFNQNSYAPKWKSKTSWNTVQVCNFLNHDLGSTSSGLPTKGTHLTCLNFT